MTDPSLPASDGFAADAAHALDGERLAEWTLRLLSFDTANPPGDTRAAVSWLDETLSGLGIETRVVAADPEKPNLLASIPADDSGREDVPTLLYVGHLDTVPYDADDWTRDPLGEREGDRIYGRGATDMKGPLAAMLSTAVRYASADVAPPIALAFAFVSDEETGGAAGVRALLDAGELSADACVIGETTCEAGRHSVTVADRGSIWLTLDAAGVAAHGSRPALGVNAADRLYAAVDDLRGWLESIAFDLPPEVEAIVDESVEYYAPMMGESTARALFEHPSVNLGIFEAGESINSVPESARARLDVRVTAGVDTEALLDRVRHRVDTYEGVSIADVSWSVGTLVDPDHPLVTATADAAARASGDHVYRRSATGGGDAKKLRSAGIHTIEFAFGTDTAHAVDEYTTLTALRYNAAVYAALPRALADDLDAQV